MLKKISDNKFQIDVNIRESFTYQLDFKLQKIRFHYYCKTDDYSFDQEFNFNDYITCDWVYSDDLSTVIDLIQKSVDWYINHNIISGSVRRAWTSFSEEYRAALNGIIMLKFNL